ncbi:MAG TPA: GntR family transcriptional regulator [Anaerolineae bacterium]|nr:GntR family transcriptional regulator [Anaerolineae bacterium]
MILDSTDINRTRTGWAYQAIRQAILSLKLEPGSLLLEDKLAEQLNISKTPVRQALQQLEGEGLVTRIPYKGTYVTQVTEQDIREIVELKAELEAMAGRLALPALTASDLIKAASFLAASDAALLAGDLTQASEQGKLFHRFIFEHASNQRLLDMLNLLDGHMQRLRLMAARTNERMEKSNHEHHLILDAIRRGEIDGVEAAFHQHLFSFRDDLLEQVSHAHEHSAAHPFEVVELAR